MSLVSFSEIEDGTDIDAADVNSPLNTIYNDYNGNVDSNNLAASSVINSKLALTVSSQANAGNAGGTMYYINLGGIKMLWCNGALATVGPGNTTLVFTLPTNFFTTIQAVIPSTAASSPATNSGVTLLNQSTATINCNLSSTQLVSMAASIFVIGT